METISRIQGVQDHEGIHWPDLKKGVLVKRYKRFLADVRLNDGSPVTAHCPNSGSMLECSTPGRPVFLSSNDNPRRKLRFTWEMIQMPTSLVGVNTLVPNRLVHQAAELGLIPELEGYADVRGEVKINNSTRLDLKLSAPRRRDCYIEVKNCTLVRDGLASFPDARTIRGQKHLRELMTLKASGARAVIFFVIQRSDAQMFSPADAIDPDYGRLLRKAVAGGVEIMVYDTVMDLERIVLNHKVPNAL